MKRTISQSIRRFKNQCLTGLTFLAPGSRWRVLLSRAKGAKIGEGCWIGDGVTIDVHFNHPNYSESMNIGSNVAIGPGVKIFTHDTAFHQISEGAVPIKFGYVTIGDNSWIGANSVVANCIIGKHCIIAPNTLVNRNVPDYSLVMGVPGEVVKSTQRLIERTQVKTDPVD